MPDTYECECAAVTITVRPDPDAPGFAIMTVVCGEWGESTVWGQTYRRMVAAECIDVAALYFDRHPHRHEERERLSEFV